eukprot:2899412-Pyramimonas_sp.AAC.1
MMTVVLIAQELSNMFQRLHCGEQPGRRRPFELVDVELRDAVARGNAMALALRALQEVPKLRAPNVGRRRLAP